MSRVALVTGGTRGIGEAISLRLKKEGYKVAASYVSRDEDAQNFMKKTGVHVYKFDVAIFDQCSEKIKEIEKDLGPIEVLINNAGHSSNHRRLLSTPETEIESVVGTNILGTVYCTQAVVEHMSKFDSGTIINVSSIAGLSPSIQGGMIYGATKSAIINFTEFINAEYKFNRIRATAIIPGEVRTPALDRRPVPPSETDRANMVDPVDIAKIIADIAEMPINVSVTQLVVRPNVSRDSSFEEQGFK